VFALIDATVWSELGAKFPEAGGSYRFLLECYGQNSWGRYASFLFVWQTTFTAPLVVASGALGFASYAQFFFTGVYDKTAEFSERVLALGVVALLTVMLYRRIKHVGMISVMLWCCVVAVMVLLIATGFVHGDMQGTVQAVAFPADGWLTYLTRNNTWLLLGVALLPTTYSYLGYYNVCLLGGEVERPERVIPRSMYASIFGIGILYVLMQISIFSIVPFEVVGKSKFVVSQMLTTVYGAPVAGIGTALILLIALASLFSVMLGYSRVPYAAARDGLFFHQFGKLHSKADFPHVSLLVMAAIASMFVLTMTISDAIKSIITMRIFTQFIAQTVGLLYLRSRVGPSQMPWRMWLFPLPALVLIVLWLWVFSSSSPLQQTAAIIAPLVGTVAFLIVSRVQHTWPFATQRSEI
jgi:amino acid transporter